MKKHLVEAIFQKVEKDEEEGIVRAFVLSKKHFWNHFLLALRWALMNKTFILNELIISFCFYKFVR